MQLWAARYASYFVALLWSFALAVYVAGMLFRGYLSRVSQVEDRWAKDVIQSRIDADFVFEDWISMLTMVTVAIGLAVALPLFRWLSAFGWQRKLLWRHAVLSCFFWVLLHFLVQWSAFEGIATKSEALALSAFLVLSIGFAWHVTAQRRAEARLESKAQEAQIDAFA